MINFKNKSVLVTLGIVVILVLAGLGLYFYQQSEVNAPTISPALSTSVNPSASPDVILDTDGITVEGGGSGGLVVCSDACGDKICQKTDTTCKPGSPNCICAETAQNCPADCR